MGNCKGGKIWTCNMVDMLLKFKYQSHDPGLHWRLRTRKYWRMLNDSLDKAFLSDSRLSFSVHYITSKLSFHKEAKQWCLNSFCFFYSLIPFLWMYLIVAIQGLGIQEAEHIKYKWLHLWSCWSWTEINSFWKTCLDKITWGKFTYFRKNKGEEKLLTFGPAIDKFCIFWVSFCHWCISDSEV